MGRNFNAILGVASAAAIVIPGGGTAPVAAEADQGPVSAPEVFKECAELVTAGGQEAVIGTDKQALLSPDIDQDWLALKRKSYWDGPIMTAGGQACNGSVELQSVLEFRGRGLTQHISGSGFLIHLATAQVPSGHEVSATVSSSPISPKRICAAIAEVRPHARQPKVKLVERNERRYMETGYPAVRTTELLSLDTDRCPPTTQGQKPGHHQPGMSEQPPIVRYPGQ
jgi:hypothetical protein